MELNTLTRYESIARELRRLGTPRRQGRTQHHDGIECDAHSYRLAKHVLMHSTKGFLVGFGGRLLFSLLPALLRSRNPARFARIAASRLARRGPYAYGLFVAVLLGTYNTIMAASRHSGGRLGRYRGVAAGFLSGWAILFLPPDNRSGLALFFFVRALEVLVRTAVDKGLLPAVPHADTALMVAASAQVIWCWIFRPSALQSTYLRFLNHHGGRDIRVIRAVGSFYLEGRRLRSVGPINQVRSAHRVPLLSATAPPRDTIFAILHNERGHPFSAMVRFWLAALLRSVRVYLPVFLIPLLLFNRSRLLRAPAASLSHVAAGIARSSVFLATYCTTGWTSVYAAERFLGLSHHINGFLGGALAGAAVLLEKKPRRIELGLYVGTQALESLWRIHRHRLGLPPLTSRPIPPLLFAFSLGVLMHAFNRRPRTLRATYRSLLRQVAGSPPAQPRIFDPTPSAGAKGSAEKGGDAAAPAREGAADGAEDKGPNPPVQRTPSFVPIPLERIEETAEVPGGS